MKIYLDDEREAPQGWHLIRTATETIELLRKEKVIEISLDHDLGDDISGTGYDVILWIENAVIEGGFTPPKIHIHSANVSARVKMELGVEKIIQLTKSRN